MSWNRWTPNPGPGTVSPLPRVQVSVFCSQPITQIADRGRERSRRGVELVGIEVERATGTNPSIFISFPSSRDQDEITARFRTFQAQVQ